MSATCVFPGRLALRLTMSWQRVSRRSVRLLCAISAWCCTIHFHDVVELTVLLVHADDIAAYRCARDRAVGDARPASTLMVVVALTHPDWLVEMDAVAARKLALALDTGAWLLTSVGVEVSRTAVAMVLVAALLMV